MKHHSGSLRKDVEKLSKFARLSFVERKEGIVKDQVKTFCTHPQRFGSSLEAERQRRERVEAGELTALF